MAPMRIPDERMPDRMMPDHKKSTGEPVLFPNNFPGLLHRFDNLSHSVVGDIAQQTIFTLLTSTILFYGAFLADIVKRAVEEFRHVMHNSVNFWVAIDQDQVTRLFVLTVKLTNQVFSLCPQSK